MRIMNVDRGAHLRKIPDRIKRDPPHQDRHALIYAKLRLQKSHVELASMTGSNRKSLLSGERSTACKRRRKEKDQRGKEKEKI
jgi:hypothetical protein